LTIQIITSSYPSDPTDATSTAGLFVRDFALGLVRQGHKVILMTLARKEYYVGDPGITIIPLPWKGGDQELASLDFKSPINWLFIIHFLLSGCHKAVKTARHFCVDKTLCMWVVPSGILGWWAKKRTKIPYDVWALGSDIWNISKIMLGKAVLRSIILNANLAFADGFWLCNDVERLSGRKCIYLASSRKLPPPEADFPNLTPEHCKHFLFVGRYHLNKGPDVLIEAITRIAKTKIGNTRFHIFGYGKLKDLLVLKIKKYNLYPYVNLNDIIEAQQLSNYLSKCDFIIIPSRIESIPVILSDALQRSVTPIVSDVGDMGVLVKKYNAGYVFPSEQPDALADLIEKALDIDKDFYLHGIQELAGMFDIDNSCKAWFQENGQLRRGGI